MDELNILLSKSKIKFPDGAKKKIYEYLGGIDCDMICKAISPLYNIEFNSELINDCIANNYCKLLKYVYKISQKKKIYNSSFYVMAVEYGNIEMFNLLDLIFTELLGYNYTNDINSSVRLNCLSTACANGKIVMLDYLISLCPSDLIGFNLCQYAVRSNRIEVLEHVIKLGCIPDFATFAAVASTGNNDMLDWLTAHDYYAINSSAFEGATHSNNLSMIKKLYRICKSKNIHWKGDNLMHIAASIGNYEIYLWFKKHKCVIHAGSIESATTGGCLQIMQDIFNSANASDRAKYFYNMLISAAILGKATDETTVQILIWLESIGIINYPNGTMARAISRNKPITIEYLHAHGCNPGPNPLQFAIHNGKEISAIKIAQLYGFTPADLRLAQVTSPPLKQLVDYLLRN